MKISLLVAFACAIYIANAATVYSPEVVRQKRSPILGTAALGLGGAALLGAGAAGVLGAGVVGAAGLGAAGLVAKGALIGGGLGYARSFGGYGGYGGHSYYSPNVHVVYVDHHYGGGYHGGYYDW